MGTRRRLPRSWISQYGFAFVGILWGRSVRLDASKSFLALKAGAGCLRVRHLWAILLRAIPNPNAADRPEDWEK